MELINLVELSVTWMNIVGKCVAISVTFRVLSECSSVEGQYILTYMYMHKAGEGMIINLAKRGYCNAGMCVCVSFFVCICVRSSISNCNFVIQKMYVGRLLQSLIWKYPGMIPDVTGIGQRSPKTWNNFWTWCGRYFWFQRMTYRFCVTWRHIWRVLIKMVKLGWINTQIGTVQYWVPHGKPKQIM